MPDGTQKKVADRVLIRSDLPLPQLGEFIRATLNAAPTNRRVWCREQLRESQNYGGLYFLLDVFDLELTLMSNAGETEIGNAEQWPYYAHVSTWDPDHDREDASRGCILLASALTRAGVAAQIEYRSPPQLG